MRIDIVFPVLPPTLDGIGDHTARLAEALSKLADVRVLTAQEEYDPIPGVEIESAFYLASRSGFRELVSAVRKQPPDWLLLQFNQFSYGRWGLNPFVPWVLYMIRKMVPETRISVLFHEDFVPVTNWKNAIMTTWQRAQFLAIGRRAQHIFFSIEPWVNQYETWFSSSLVRHLPVGSNIPKSSLTREAARKCARIEDEAFAIGLFGTVRSARLITWIRKAALKIFQRDSKAYIHYVGPDGAEVKQMVKGMPVRDAGRLPAEEVGKHLRCMDLHLAPFVDGLSTRRGSVMAGLQHGVPTVSTRGPLTDRVWMNHNEEAVYCTPVQEQAKFVDAALVLHSNRNLRKQLGHAGEQLYNTRFDWPIIATTIVSAFERQQSVLTGGL